MKVALSPCPNDTFLFYGWLAGHVGAPPEPHFADIQELNTLAYTGEFPLIKISFHCLAHVLDMYEMLPVGAALGMHCGPKVIAKTAFSLDELPKKRVAIPGEETTAHLLFNRLLPAPKEKRFCLYHEVVDLIERGEVDCGVIIHETRFTYASRGLMELVDLGELWGPLPLPLGCLAIRHDFPNKRGIVELLQASLTYGYAHREETLPFILAHAQEKEGDVVAKHIATYVNEETAALSERGIESIERLLCIERSSFLPTETRQPQPSTR